MAIANLHESLLSYTMRKNELYVEIGNFQAQKQLAIASQADVQSLLSSGKHEIRDYFKNLYENDPELQAKYKSYTEIEEFEEEIDKIVAKYQDELDQLTAWETSIDAQITTDSAEIEEVKAYMDTLKSMLSSNISEDFDYGLGN